MQKCKVKSIKRIGVRKTYNLTMQSGHHNYSLFDEKTGDSVITKNSHSACYAYNSYTTAYLKANYPDEFICSLLDVTANSSVADKFEKVEAFEKEFKRKMHVKILPRDINKSKSKYSIEKRKDLKTGIKKTEIRPSLLFKGVGLAAAQEIEKHQPYEDLRDLVEKVSSSIVDVRTVEALAAGGYFGKQKKDNTKGVADAFRSAREDIKKVKSKKVESVDIFA